MNNELLSNVFTSDEEVLAYLKKDADTYREYSVMRDEWKQRFMDFCTGKKTLPILYDTFFKRIFHPDVHPERLSNLISSLIGEKVRVKKILPLEDNYIDGARMVVMDILVEAEDGSIANVEVQKNPYLFPGERISCYSSDIVLRQYSRTRGEKGKDFLYEDLRKVYTIVIYERTEGIFHELPGKYIHHGKVQFDTGLRLDLLQEYCLVALDVFRDIPYHKEKSILTGWLSFFTTENYEDAEKLVEEYPWLEEIYKEVASYRERPKEVLMMFSDALRELDRNTMQYMIDEQKKEIDEQKRKIEENAKVIEENAKVIEENAKVIEENQKVIKENQKVIKENQKQMEEQDKKIEEMELENKKLRQLLEQSSSTVV